MLSDFEIDLLENDSFQQPDMVIRATGPNIDTTSISSLEFRNNAMSYMNRPSNMNRPRYAESVSDLRTMSYRREREGSTLSYRSASGLQPPRNFNHSYYHGGEGSRATSYYGRSGSPMSVRSSRTIDSNMSINASTIAYALKKMNFDKSDSNMIKEACYKYLKGKRRRRFDNKKKNVRKFLKGFRRMSGGDSGDQASNSSISSDDDSRSIKSSRSTIHTQIRHSSRPPIANVSEFRREMRENYMARDCTDDMRQNISYKNRMPAGPPNFQENLQTESHNMLKDRFKGSFLLPSQHFNQTAVSSLTSKPSQLQSICENSVLDARTSMSRHSKRQGNENNSDSDTEQDDIFDAVSLTEKNSNLKRRRQEKNDILAPDSKKIKLLSPIKNPRQKQLNTNKPSDHIFAVPQLPIKKQAINLQNKLPNKKSQVQDSNLKVSKSNTESRVPTNSHSEEMLMSSSQKPQEKLLAKSKQALEPEQSVSLPLRYQPEDKQDKESCERAESTQLSTTDMSLRQSFIKRKLFTQKIDDTANNSSSDSLQANSPQNNIYSKIQKEKNKARKLASQSCLNRDVTNDSNLLDLIHKVVPADRMSEITLNKTELPNNKSKPNNYTADKTDRFDVTSVTSETFTDQDIFTEDDNQTQVTEQNYQTKVKDYLKANEPEAKEKQSKIVQSKSNHVDEAVSSSKVVKKQTYSNTVFKPNKPATIKKTIKPHTTKLSKKKGELQQITAGHCNQKKEVAAEKQTNCQPKESTSEVFVAATKLTPEHRNKTSATNRNDFHKAVYRIWDTDTENEFENSPMRSTTHMTQPDSRTIKNQPKTDTAISEFQKSTTNDKINAQVLGTIKKAPIIQKQNKKSEKTNDHNSNPKGTSNKNGTKISTKFTDEIKNTKNVNKKTEVLSSTKENQPPKKSNNKGTSNKNGTNITEKLTDENKSPVKNKHFNKTTEMLSSTKENQPPKKSNYKGTPTKNGTNITAKLTDENKCPVKNKHVNKKTEFLSSTNKNQPPKNKTPNENQSKTPKQRKDTSQKVTNQSSERSERSKRSERRQLRVNINKMSCNCCNNSDAKGSTDSSLYRSLRSREVDLSLSIQSGKGSAYRNRKPASKNNRISKLAENKAEKTLESDMSFTLKSETPVANRTLRNRKTRRREK